MYLYVLFASLFMSMFLVYAGYKIYGYYTYRLYPDPDDFLPFLCIESWKCELELKTEMEACGGGWIHWIDFDETVQILLRQGLVYQRDRNPYPDEAVMRKSWNPITELKLSEKGERTFIGVVETRCLIHTE